MPPTRYDLAEKLPPEISYELKWMAWNEIWSCVNRIVASRENVKEREKKLKQSKQDIDRASQHYRIAVSGNKLEATTIFQIRRQAEIVGLKAGHAAVEGQWLGPAKCEVLERPWELAGDLWDQVVAALRTAGITINMMARNDFEKGTPLQREFESLWEDLTWHASPFEGRL